METASATGACDADACTNQCGHHRSGADASEKTMLETVGCMKRCTCVADSLCEAYECPITCELPFDPVTAEDGLIYERSAIEHWFGQTADRQAKSPMTGEMIGKILLPSSQLRNLLTNMVRDGFIVGPKARAWNLAMQNKQKVAVLVKEAEKGSALAMGSLGFAYRDGTRGLHVDAVKAFSWFKAAADNGDAPSATSCGVAYINGSGVSKNQVRGISMLSTAATLGSEHACAALGLANECGHFGFDVNIADAKKWYEQMKQATCKDSEVQYRERASKFLEENP